MLTKEELLIISEKLENTEIEREKILYNKIRLLIGQITIQEDFSNDMKKIQSSLKQNLDELNNLNKGDEDNV